MGIEQFSVSNQEEIPEPAVELVSNLGSEKKDREPSSEQGLSVDERLEAREFSKENSRAARKRLAEQIVQKRRWYRVTIPEIIARQDTAVALEQEKTAGQQAERLQTIEELEKNLASLKTDREQWVALETELSEVETQLEKVKAGFWAYFLNRFTKKIDQLRDQRQRLYEQEAETPFVHEYQVPNTERDLEQKNALHQQSTQYEKGGLQEMLDKNKKELQRLIEDDNWVETSEKQIKRFYEKNLDLKREREENPEERDVVANCRKNNVVLMHGFSIYGNNHGDNNPSFDMRSSLGAEGAFLMAALEPAVSASSKSLDVEQSVQFPRQEMYSSTGFILAGGEITSAYSRDAGTYAHDLDSRFPKYDASAVSDYQEDISNQLEKVINSNDRKFLQSASYNEISVKHPKLAALYVHDEDDAFGKEFSDGNYSHTGSLRGEAGTRKLKIMLGLAEKMGLPLILTKKSGEMVSLTEGNRPVTLDELLDNPVQYSPEERMEFLAEANIAEKMRETTGEETQQQMDKKIVGFTKNFDGVDPVMEERKQRNKDLATVQLRLLNL